MDKQLQHALQNSLSAREAEMGLQSMHGNNGINDAGRSGRKWVMPMVFLVGGIIGCGITLVAFVLR